jgi:hypothetical protein
MNRASHVLLNRAGQLLALLCLSIGASAAAAAPAPEIRSLIDIP